MRAFVLALLGSGVLLACATPTEPIVAGGTAQGMGRIVGAREGLREYVASCADEFSWPDDELERAFAFWQWRNDPVAARVAAAFWARQRSRAAATAVEAAQAAFARTMEDIRAEVHGEYRSWSDAERRDFCAALPAKIESGTLDLRSKYADDIDAWERGDATR